MTIASKRVSERERRAFTYIFLYYGFIILCMRMYINIYTVVVFYLIVAIFTLDIFHSTYIISILLYSFTERNYINYFIIAFSADFEYKIKRSMFKKKKKSQSLRYYISFS